MLDVAQLAGELPVDVVLEELAPDLNRDGRPGRPVVVVDADSAAGCPGEAVRTAAQRLSMAAPLVVAVARSGPVPDCLADAADIVLCVPALPVDRRAVVVGDLDAAVEEVVTAAAAHPMAVLSMAWLLRGGAGRSTRDGLLAESSTYSTLLAGPEFGAWLAHRGPRRAADAGERVRLERASDELHITLDRPQRRNAVDAAMRQALVEALTLAAAEPDLAVHISGAGPSFCAGGDLDEFGRAPDPATAHLVRIVSSPAALLDRMAARTTVRVHGAGIGAGMELPAFAGRVVAAPDAIFGLPEIGMGLIPGAGGTVSIPRRIGRQRTAWLAVTGSRLDASTAHEWGLVDAVG